MAEGTLGAVLEREHREIDQAIESYISGSTAGENPAEPLVVAIRALRRHIYLEEAFLFPPLRDAGLIAPVFVMLREHGQMWKTMDALESTVRSGTSHASVLPAEIRVLRYLPTTLSFALIAHKLGISRGAAKMRAERLYEKLDVHSRVQAVERARSLHVLP